MSWNNGLSGPALQIASVAAKNLRVMAGPGTGKSFAMKRRVHRLSEEGANPQRILALTFTRVAGQDLVKELKALGVAGCESIRAGTLHGYCFSILAEKSVLQFSGRVARPLQTYISGGVMQYEAGPMLVDILISQFGTRRDCTKRVRAYESAWARLQSDTPGWPLDPTDNAFQIELTNWMKFHKTMLIGELVPETLRYLRNNPTAPEHTAFDHVIVDEYQDLNKADQELINLLAANAESLIIGDVDQSIYGFRHAHPGGIDEYHLTHSGTHDESLDECRRCPTKVVELADSLIKNNYPATTLPRLKPLAGNPEGEIHIVQWATPEEEVEGTSLLIKHLIDDRHYKAPEILVLSHRRKFGYELRDRLNEMTIPAHSYFLERMYDDDGMQKSLTTLTLLARPEDRVALRVWLGMGSPSFYKTQYAELRAYCERTGESPREALVKAVSGTIIGKVEKLVLRFSDLEHLRSECASLTTIEIFDRLFPETELWATEIREKVREKITGDYSIDQLTSLIENAVTHPEPPAEDNAVRIMSPHGSKGLTNKIVIVLNCVQGLMPQINIEAPPAEQAAQMNEQRRLFYVAITRPTELLVISSYAKIDLGAAHKIKSQFVERRRITTASPSPFINELGPSAPSRKDGRAWLENGFK